MLMRVECRVARKGVLAALVDQLGWLRGVECCLGGQGLRAWLLASGDFVEEILPFLVQMLGAHDLQGFAVHPLWPRHVRELARVETVAPELTRYILRACGFRDRVCVVRKTTRKVAVLRLAEQPEILRYQTAGANAVIRRSPQAECVAVPGRDIPEESLTLAYLERFPPEA